MRVEEAERLEPQLGRDMTREDMRAESLVLRTFDHENGTVETTDGPGFGIDRGAMSFSTSCWFDENPPQEGDEITLWTTGGRIAGVALRGRTLYLKTEREQNLEWLLFRASLGRQRREDFQNQKGELDAKYDALPPKLKDRVDRLRGEDPEFRAEGEAYEMAALSDALPIARAIADQHGWGEPDHYGAWHLLEEEEVETAVKEFHDLDHEEQIRRVPSLKNSGHSGFTFGAACTTARALLLNEPV